MPERAGFSIRRLVAADAAAFRALRLKGVHDHPDIFTASYADWDVPLETYHERLAGSHVVGAFDDETSALLGHALLATHVPISPKLRHKVELWSVYVLPEARRRGIARALTAHMIDAARTLGFAWLKLQVAAHNTSAKAMYDSLGFETFGFERDFLRLPDGRSVDEYWMHLKL